MNVIKLKVDFTKREIWQEGVNIVENDYNSTKIVFEFDKEYSGRKVFEMAKPNTTEAIFVSEIIDNEVILVGKSEVKDSRGYIKYVDNEENIYWYDKENNKIYDEEGIEQTEIALEDLTKVLVNASIFSEEGKYPFEISLYDGDSKLTSMHELLPVTKEYVKVGNEQIADKLPIFDQLIAELNLEKEEVNNINITSNKEGRITTVVITKKDGTKETTHILDGIGIESIEKTSTEGLVDTYTITYTNEETQDFDVTNGTTFTPSVDENGNISWSNDGGKENPQTRNIKGDKGDTGAGVKTGGTTGQVLKKNSNTDFDTKWEKINYNELEGTENISKFTNDSNYQTGTEVANKIGEHNQSGTAHLDIRQLINLINALIPTQASPTNQVGDKDFINSSLNSITAFYITKNANGDQFDSKEELDETTTFYSGGEVRVPTRNDYCVVLSDESKQDPITLENPTTRYIYQNGQWEYQYTVNKTALTAAQLAAINSGITQALVTQIGTNQTNIQNLNNNKEDKSNKVSSVNSDSTHQQYPTAKCLYDLVGNINEVLATLTTVGGV